MRLLLIAALAAFLSQACRREQPALQIQPGSDTVAVARMSAPPQGMGASAYLAFSLPCGRDSLVAFYNDTAEGEEYIRQERLDSARTDHGVFVSTDYVEGGDYSFIAKADCARLSFTGRPFLSPSGSRFAALGTFQSFSGSEIIVAALDARGARIELRDTVREATAVESRWLDDSTWTAELARWDSPGLRRTLSLRAGKWSADTSTVPLDTASDAAPPYPEAAGDSAGL